MCFAWVRCGAGLYRFVIFAFILTLGDEHYFFKNIYTVN